MTDFPFTGLVDQTRMKRALVLNAINPDIGGVLIRGERGTAKSTAVRALADLLPPKEVVVDCQFGCPPDEPDRMCKQCRSRFETDDTLRTERQRTSVVDLPLNASEDRVVGTIDLEHAVQRGERAFEPGILAEANRNVLYVDEVNLLDDHIVDILLDAAAMKENVVEREGVSYRHPSEFVLVGTMNPEEGDLRPQLLDRFGLVVDVEGSDDVEMRCQIAERREGFDADPAAFRAAHEASQQALRERIQSARERLPEVSIDDELLSEVASESLRKRVDGLRADIVIQRVARAIAAFEGDTEVTDDHVQEAQYFAFPHRVRGVTELDLGLDIYSGTPDSTDDGTEQESDEQTTDGTDGSGGVAGGLPLGDGEASYPVDRTAIDPEADGKLRERLARRAPSRVDITSGRYVRAREQQEVDDIAFDATIRAAATRQTTHGGEGIRIEPDDLKQKVRQRTAEALLVFVVDASGSVMNGTQMEETKRGLVSLLEDAYRSRDRVAVVSFRGEDATVIVEPTQNVTMAREAASNMRVGGNTPLAHGLVRAYELIKRERRRDENVYPLTVLLTDGKANVEYREDGDPWEDTLKAASLFADESIPSVFVDTGYRIDTTVDDVYTEKRANRIKRKQQERRLTLAETMGADYLPLVDLPRNSTLPTGTEVTTT